MTSRQSRQRKSSTIQTGKRVNFLGWLAALANGSRLFTESQTLWYADAPRASLPHS